MACKHLFPMFFGQITWSPMPNTMVRCFRCLVGLLKWETRQKLADRIPVVSWPPGQRRISYHHSHSKTCTDPQLPITTCSFIPARWTQSDLYSPGWGFSTKSQISPGGNVNNDLFHKREEDKNKIEQSEITTTKELKTTLYKSPIIILQDVNKIVKSEALLNSYAHNLLDL